MGGRVVSWLGALLGGLVVVSGLGCATGGQYRSDSDWTSDEKTELEGVGDPEDLTGTRPSSAGFDPNKDWVGVRHDLIIAPNHPKEANCNCLAVVVGEPTDAKFRWQGNQPPEVSGDKLAVAISGRGVDCPGGDPDDSKRRPSISAVDERGHDVFIEVEELPPGRPIASGALIRHPRGEGGVYIKGKTTKLPYAREKGAGIVNPCRVY